MTLLAAIDMGTGAMRTYFARIGVDGVPIVEDRKNYRYTLADDIRRGIFSDESMAEVLSCCAQAIADIRANGAVFAGAAATEAFRKASNGEELLKLIQTNVGLSVRLISGEDELRMSYQGAAPYVHHAYDSIIFADSGAGSTEVAHISHKQRYVHNWVSLKMGLVTHLHEMGEEDITSPERFSAIKHAFKEIILTGCKENGINPGGQSLVIAGASMFLAAYLQETLGQERNDYQVPGEEISYETMSELAHKICAMGKLGRSKDPIIGRNPSETFVPAAAKCLALMEVFGAKSFQAVPSGIALAMFLEQLHQSESA